MQRFLQWMRVLWLCCAAGCAAQGPTAHGGPDPRLLEAQAAFDEASRLDAEGRYDEALKRARHALELREAVLGNPHSDVARSLNQLANIHDSQGSYDQAELLYRRALSIQESIVGSDHPSIAAILSNLSLTYKHKGMYALAEENTQRIASIYEKSLDKDDPRIADALDIQAGLYRIQGLYERAEPLFLRVLAIKQKAFGDDNPEVAATLNDLALIYWNQGLYDKAESLFTKVIAIDEKALGSGHPNVALILVNLASIYKDQGLYKDAERLYLHSLSIQEAALGKEHPDVAGTLNNLALIYWEQGLYDQAESNWQRSLSIKEKTLGEHHPDVAATLFNLARLYMDQGAYDRAEALLARTRSIYEASFGPSHPDLADLFNNLAQLRLAQNRLSEAVALYTRAFNLSEQRLRHEALDLSESRLAQLLKYLRKDEQSVYSLLRAHPEDVQVRRLALSAALLLKGRSVEETTQISRTISLHLGAGDRATFERLRGLRTQLATLAIEETGPSSATDYQKLSEESDRLETDLARRSASLRALTELPQSSEIVNRVAASLPQDSALVEFIAYKDVPLILPPGTSRGEIASLEQRRYLALVLFPDASTRAVDLGAASLIDDAASRLHAALANEGRVPVQALARQLHTLAFLPLRSALGQTRHLFLSPDGPLDLIPFAALHDGHDFLIDSFDFTYLTSGRELLSRPEEPRSSIVVFADSDAAEPLQNARLEAQNIQRLLPQAQLFLGPESTRERLFHLSTPGILHLATHGFFLGNTPASGHRVPASVAVPNGMPEAKKEPLLNSGIFLARARATDTGPSSSPDDTVLVTALELAGLDLWGTQLVVLSACNSGRGDIQPDQDVYGLRSALVTAGAETVVMSLWEVADDSTSLLMDLYYHHLVAGHGRASALREAMRALRASRFHPHPHDWAPFISLGNPAPLRAMTPSP